MATSPTRDNDGGMDGGEQLRWTSGMLSGPGAGKCVLSQSHGGVTESEPG